MWGLELTSASRAGFLVQLTTVIVPVLEAFLGRRKLKPQVSKKYHPVDKAAFSKAVLNVSDLVPDAVGHRR